MSQQTVSRRDFLRVTLAGCCGAAVHRMLTPMHGMMAYAAPTAAAVGPLPVMVLVNLTGGCSYNIANPLNPAYLSLNPNVSYTAATGIPISGEQVLHPSLTNFKSVFDEGKLAVINMAGYPNPNRSHDESMLIWLRGRRDSSGGAITGGIGGWPPLLTAQMASRFGGIALSSSSAVTSGEGNPPRAFGDLQNFGEQGFWGGEMGTKWLRDTRTTLLLDSNPLPNDNFRYVRQSMDDFETSAVTITRETQQAPPGTFPNTGLGRRLRDAARLIQARSLAVQFIYVEIGGFDTHANERQSLTNLMNEINGAVGAFVSSVKTMGRWDDLILLTMSEFSRTFENGSMGTDHGHAGAMFVMGGGVNGGIKTPAPTSADTSAARGYYHGYHVDFRQVFKEAVAAMRYDPNAVFSEPIPNTTYTNLGLF